MRESQIPKKEGAPGGTESVMGTEEGTRGHARGRHLLDRVHWGQLGTMEGTRVGLRWRGTTWS